jgi:magnesium-transporting ATPase (P-type)
MYASSHIQAAGAALLGGTVPNTCATRPLERLAHVQQRPAVRLTLPIAPVRMLWVKLLTAVTLAIALAFEPTADGTTLRPPRSRREPVLRGAFVWHVVLVPILLLCGVYGLYAHAIDEGASVDLARAPAVNMLVVATGVALFAIFETEKQIRLLLRAIRTGSRSHRKPRIDNARCIC